MELLSGSHICRETIGLRGIGLSTRDALITAIDVGASKICAVVAQGTEPLGVAMIPIPGWLEHPRSRSDLAPLVVQAVAEADEMAGQHTTRVWLSLSGTALKYRSSHGVVRIDSPNGRVTQADLDRAIEAAVYGDTSYLHRLLTSTVLDGRELPESALGREGKRLEVNLLLVEAEEKDRLEYQRIIEDAQLRPAGFVAASLAASSVMTPVEREIGTAVLDLGATHTTAAIYLRGGLRSLSVLGVGGLHVTKDLSVALGLPLARAEQIKFETLSPEADESRLATAAGRVIAARLGETLELVNNQINGAGWADRLPGGFVLTGGGAPPKGLMPWVSQVLGVPARLGLPNLDLAGGMSAGPSYAVVLGLAAAVQQLSRPDTGLRSKGGSRWRSWFPQRRLPI